MNMDKTVGELTLKKDHTASTFYLVAQYNAAVTAEIEIRGADGIYDLQYLINRAVVELEASNK